MKKAIATLLCVVNFCTFLWLMHAAFQCHHEYEMVGKFLEDPSLRASAHFWAFASFTGALGALFVVICIGIYTAMVWTED